MTRLFEPASRSHPRPRTLLCFAHIFFIQPIVLGSYFSKQDRGVDRVGTIRFSTALGSQRSLNCYNQSRGSDTLSRRTQTIWNAQYPLWLGHHVRTGRPRGCCNTENSSDREIVAACTRNSDLESLMGWDVSELRELHLKL